MKNPPAPPSRRRRRHQPRRRSMECVRGMCTRVGGGGWICDGCLFMINTDAFRLPESISADVSVCNGLWARETRKI
jgi:hypothetical protein